MIEIILGTYGVACWALFKYKVVPTNTYTVCTAILGGIIMLVFLGIALSICHPVSHDGRLYVNVTQIVPEVRGKVIEVPVKAGEPLKQGDVLFRIDPAPYQFEVDRLKALLTSKNAKVAKLKEQMLAAEASTRDAEAKLIVAESQFDRQAREAVEHAAAEIQSVQKRLGNAKVQFERYQDLVKTNTVSQQEFDAARTQMQTTEQELRQALAAEKVAQEKLKSGGSSLDSVREDIKKTKAMENQVRVELEAEYQGVNPEVRQTMAELDKALRNLDQCTVRAPYDGSVPQVIVRPGQMAVPLPLSPMMVFVSSEKPALIASYPQNVIQSIKPGLEAELAFAAYPGRVFKVKVKRILPAIKEGQLDVSGKLLTVTPGSARGYVPVVFEYDEQIASLGLPVGAEASVAVYTENLHALSIVRMMILRIKSWENYVIAFGSLGH